MQTQEQEQKLQQEILADARRKAERLVQRAQHDVDKALADERARQERLRQSRIDEATGLAAQKARAIQAGIEHERRRRWLQRQEQCLDRLFADALRAAEQLPPDRARAALLALVTDAVAAVGPGHLVLRVAPAHRAWLDPETLAAIAGRAAATAGAAATTFEVVADERIGAGVLAVSADGRRQVDNTCRMRLRRLQPELRARAFATVAGGRQQAAEGRNDA